MKQRQSNFELIRIIAMLMIVASHYLGHGILKVNSSEEYEVFLKGDFINRLISVLYSPGGKTGVALFFMITGYFIGNKKTVISQKKVVIQCLFYAILTTAATSIIAITHISNNIGYGSVFNMVKILPIPISSGAWWFVSTYVLIVIFAPLLNRLIDNINNKGAVVLLLYFGVLYGVCGFDTVYYNILRAPLYYLAGAFIHNRNITIKKSSYKCVAFSISVITWSAYSVIRYLQIDHIHDTATFWKAFVFLSDYLMSGVLIPIIAISLFLFLASFEFSNAVINKIASTTFGVYLLHDSNIGRELIWNEIVCPERTQFNLVWYYYMPLSIVTIVGIFIICALIDIVRQVVFEKWMNKQADRIIRICKNRFYYDKTL